MPEAAPADLTSNVSAGSTEAGDQGSGTADTTTTQTDNSTQQTETTDQTQPDTKSVEYWQHRARENEAKAKANAKAAGELAKLKDKDKTDQERLTEELAKAKAAQDAAEAQLMKSRVASEKGLPPEMAPRLTGTTEAEIGADADALLATIKGLAPAPADLKQGSRGDSKAPADVDAWIRKAAGR